MATASACVSTRMDRTHAAVRLVSDCPKMITHASVRDLKSESNDVACSSCVYNFTFVYDCFGFTERYRASKLLLLLLLVQGMTIKLRLCLRFRVCG